MGGKNNFFNKTASNLGLMGSGGVFGGADSLQNKGAFRLTPEAIQAEREALMANQQIASGQAPSTAAMQYNMALNQAAQAQNQAAASARGVNPALAFRAAADATGQMQAEAAGQSALMAEEERRRAREAIAQMVAAQRGVALQGAQANLGARGEYRKQTFDLLGNLGAAAASAGAGGGK
jgi:hypothetical protein